MDVVSKVWAPVVCGVGSTASFEAFVIEGTDQCAQPNRERFAWVRERFVWVDAPCLVIEGAVKRSQQSLVAFAFGVLDKLG